MNINISSPINNTGYGVASFNILKEISKKSRVSYFPISNPGVSSQQEHDFVMSLVDSSKQFDVDAPFLKIWHQFDLLSHIGKGKYYGFPFFELDTFYDFERRNMEVPDVLFVSSKWAKDVVIKNGIKTHVEVIPLGVDRSIFDSSLYSDNSSDEYVFLNIGKWEIRKGHDILAALFKQAFPTEKDVRLKLLASLVWGTM